MAQRHICPTIRLDELPSNSFQLILLLQLTCILKTLPAPRCSYHCAHRLHVPLGLWHPWLNHHLPYPRLQHSENYVSVLPRVLRTENGSWGSVNNPFQGISCVVQGHLMTTKVQDEPRRSRVVPEPRRVCPSCRWYKCHAAPLH